MTGIDASLKIDMAPNTNGQRKIMHVAFKSNASTSRNLFGTPSEADNRHLEETANAALHENLENFQKQWIVDRSLNQDCLPVKECVMLEAQENVNTLNIYKKTRLDNIVKRFGEPAVLKFNARVRRLRSTPYGKSEMILSTENIPTPPESPELKSTNTEEDEENAEEEKKQYHHANK